MTRYSIGIVGYGDFSKLLIEHLSPYADITVHSRSHESGNAGFGAQFATLETVLACSVIIPSIPSQFFEDFFTTNAGLINPSAIVVDVCSVKVRPLEVLQRLLPETCQIIGTHPLLGPASVQKNGGLRGLRMAVCDVRTNGDTYQKCIQFLSGTLGLKIIEKTPEQHDRDMAYVQGLSHYIGRVMDIMKIPDTELSTFAYDDLVEMKNIQGQDSWELFVSIMEENPHTHSVNADFKRAIKELDDKLTAPS